MSDWDSVSKVKTETYTIVPIEDVYDLKIEGLDKRMQIETRLSGEDNGSSVNMSGAAFKENAEDKDGNAEIEIKEIGQYGISWKKTNSYTISGSVDGKTVNIPEYYIVGMDDNSSFEFAKNKIKNDKGEVIRTEDIKLQIGAVRKDALKWSDLYNVNDAVKSRKDAIK